MWKNKILGVPHLHPSYSYTPVRGDTNKIINILNVISHSFHLVSTSETLILKTLMPFNILLLKPHHCMLSYVLEVPPPVSVRTSNSSLLTYKLPKVPGILHYCSARLINRREHAVIPMIKKHPRRQMPTGQFTLHASRCVKVDRDAARRVICIFSVQASKVLPDTCSYNGVTKR